MLCVLWYVCCAIKTMPGHKFSSMVSNFGCLRLEPNACRRMFQGAVSGAACDHTTAAEIDKAFPPGFSIPDSFHRLVVALLHAV